MYCGYIADARALAPHRWDLGGKRHCRATAAASSTGDAALFLPPLAALTGGSDVASGSHSSPASSSSSSTSCLTFRTPVWNQYLPLLSATTRGRGGS